MLVKDYYNSIHQQGFAFWLQKPCRRNVTIEFGRKNRKRYFLRKHEKILNGFRTEKVFPSIQNLN